MSNRKAAKPAKSITKRGTLVPTLCNLFNAVGAKALSVNLARDLAAAYGLNRTSAELTFYRWRDGLYGKPAVNPAI